jgi:hypothetical protein
MNSIAVQILGAVSLMVCLSCASTSSSTGLPEHFLTGKDPRFPNDRYITGVGQGHDVSQARLTALADIGAQIQSKIESTLVSHEEAIAGPRGGATVSQVSNAVRQRSTFDHRGVATIADTVVKDDVVHVLAVLDRAAAAASFRHDDARVRDSLRRALADFQVALSRLDLRGAARLAKQICPIASELAAALVLIESISGVAAPADEWADLSKAAQVDADLRAMRAQASIEFCLAPAPDFPEASQLVQALMGQTAARGVAALPCGKVKGKATLRVEGSISAVFSTEAMLGNAVFCRPAVDLHVVQVSTGAEVISAPLGGDPARAAGRDREAATRAALKKLTALAAPKLSEVLGED